MRIAAALSTVPTAARAATARAVVERILPQVDVLHVHLVEEPPAWTRHRRVVVHRYARGTGPAVRLTVVPNADVVLFLDDDMVYPSDYAKVCASHLERLGAGIAIGFHASHWPAGAPPRFRARKLLSYSDAVLRDEPVTMVSMITASMHVADLRRIDRAVPAQFRFEDDIWLSAACARARIRMVRPASRAGWIASTPAAAEGIFSRARADGFVARDAAIRAAVALGGWRLTRP